MALLLALGSLLQGCAVMRDMLYAPGDLTIQEVSWHGDKPRRIQVPTEGGVQLDGYYWPGLPGNDTILIYFHGRHGNAEIGARAGQYLAGHGDAVLVAAYRGFGDNDGSPSQKRMLADAAAFISEARTLAGPDAKVWLVGHSIGSAVALHAAAADPDIDGVFALSAFARIRESAPPVTRAFIPDKWNNLEIMPELATPVIVMQGALDRFIPADSGARIFDAGRGPIMLASGARSYHNPDMTVLGPWIVNAISAIETGGIAAVPDLPENWSKVMQRP